MSVSAMPPLGSIIRVYAVYSKPEHIQNIIKRCENHQKNKQFEDGSKIPDIAIDHLIRCKHEQAIYQQDPNNKRHSVIVPYEKPSGKVQFSDKNISKIFF
jgi:hypothetical protein